MCQMHGFMPEEMTVATSNAISVVKFWAPIVNVCQQKNLLMMNTIHLLRL